ncbi:unnamed protein product [Callosobruchus maculatus]|uniref:Uncharacterized protein n=1 Tax=Callosobruchus maculatus TaxID=64391 RepID=A0A653BF78_CALMS|nr:unnamed protein product [Callosobruchus maculatus]
MLQALFWSISPYLRWSDINFYGNKFFADINS